MKQNFKLEKNRKLSSYRSLTIFSFRDFKKSPLLLSSFRIYNLDVLCSLFCYKPESRKSLSRNSPNLGRIVLDTLNLPLLKKYIKERNPLT